MSATERGDGMPVIAHDDKPERLTTGTLTEDMGCPHCGKLCDVCVTQDAIIALEREQHRGAVEALGELADLVDGLRGPLGDSRAIRDAPMTALLVKARMFAPILRGQSESRGASDEKEETDAR
jgi:hypothetical protein